MSPRTPPTLETPRLLLRGWRGRDLKAHAEMSADPEVMRYIGDGKALDQAQSWAEVAVHIGHWALRGYGQWALERREDGASIGRAGLWNPPGWPGLEVGWKLARDAWGQGYATEAGQAAIDWAWTTLDAPELISVIQPGNAASVRVAERLGMRRLRESTLKGQAVLIFGIERPWALTLSPVAYRDSYLWRLRQVVGNDLVLMPGAMVAVQRDDQHVLLTKRGDDGTWCLPAGAAEPGGSFAGTAIDELAEETGIEVSERDLVPFGCLSEAEAHTIHYPNGDVTHCFAMCFLARAWRGDPRPDGEESTEARFVDPGAPPEPLHPPTAHALELLSTYLRSGSFQLR